MGCSVMNRRVKYPPPPRSRYFGQEHSTDLQTQGLGILLQSQLKQVVDPDDKIGKFKANRLGIIGLKYREWPQNFQMDHFQSLPRNC